MARTGRLRRADALHRRRRRLQPAMALSAARRARSAREVLNRARCTAQLLVHPPRAVDQDRHERLHRPVTPATEEVDLAGWPGTCRRRERTTWTSDLPHGLVMSGSPSTAADR